MRVRMCAIYEGERYRQYPPYTHANIRTRQHAHNLAHISHTYTRTQICTQAHTHQDAHTPLLQHNTYPWKYALVGISKIGCSVVRGAESGAAFIRKASNFSSARISFSSGRNLPHLLRCKMKGVGCRLGFAIQCSISCGRVYFVSQFS